MIGTTLFFYLNLYKVLLIKIKKSLHGEMLNILHRKILHTLFIEKEMHFNGKKTFFLLF